MRSNTATKNDLRTHEGARAARITPKQQLDRLVMSGLLWEDEFYVDGKTIADQIISAAQDVPLDTLATTAIRARKDMRLRHVPLLLLTQLIKRGRGATTGIVADTIEAVISRADEMGELLALYWKMNPNRSEKLRAPLSAQMKRGLARAFMKFDEYQLAKYDRDDGVKLRDVLRLIHARGGEARSDLHQRVLDRTLAAPDTWEVALSSGADKKETFERLIQEGKLGYLALLRNLRNMEKAGVNRGLVEAAIRARKGAQWVLPFRYVAAARAAPAFEPALDEAMTAALADMVPFPGRTGILVDVSGSMDHALSARSDMTRMIAAAALASIFPGERDVWTFSHQHVQVPPRRGMAGVDAIIRSQPNTGTDLGGAVVLANRRSYDRLVVITDEQSHTNVPAPMCGRAYMINVASARNGVGYGAWTHIDGFSERIFDYIRAVEA